MKHHEGLRVALARAAFLKSQRTQAVPEDTEDRVGGLFDGGLVDRFQNRISFGVSRMLGRNREGRLLRRIFDGDRLLRLAASERILEMVAEDGGDPGDITTVIQYIIDNWEKIFAILQQLISLFTVPV